MTRSKAMNTERKAHAMNAALLILSVLMNLFSCGILRNDFCKKEIRTPADLHVFNACSHLFSAAALAVIALLSGGLCAPSLYTLLLGVVFGVVTALCHVLNMKALQSGPLSYTSVICCCSMIVPALSGLFFFGETVTWGQCVGIVLMIISFVCAVDASNETMDTSLQWFLLCMGSFLCSGLIGVMQKVHQTSPHRDELGVFLVIAFLVSAAFSAVTAATGRTRGQAVSVTAKPRLIKFILFITICGIGIAFCNQINMYLAGVMDAMIFFPVVNGGAMLLTTLAGVMLWHEKPSSRQWFGLVVGGAAIFLLCGIL